MLSVGCRGSKKGKYQNNCTIAFKFSVFESMHSWVVGIRFNLQMGGENSGFFDGLLATNGLPRGWLERRPPPSAGDTASGGGRLLRHRIESWQAKLNQLAVDTLGARAGDIILVECWVGDNTFYWYDSHREKSLNYSTDCHFPHTFAII